MATRRTPVLLVVLALVAVAAALYFTRGDDGAKPATAQAVQFQPGDAVTYDIKGTARNGEVIAVAGDMALVSRNSSSEIQHYLPVSALRPREGIPTPTPTPTPTPSPTPTPTPPAGGLAFEHPPLMNPRTVQVPATGGSFSFGDTEDAILDLPDQPVSGQVAINGGSDIRIVGGQVGGTPSYSGTYGIVARNLRGSLSIEGVVVDQSAYTDKDSIVVTGYSPCGTGRSNWTYPKVYIQRSRILGSKYSGGAMHPDLYQKQGPMGSLYVDSVTGESSYQGLQIGSQTFSSSCSGGGQESYTEGLKDGSKDVDGEAVIQRTNLRHRSDQLSGYLAWFIYDAGSNGGFSGEDPYPVRLSDFYVKGRPQGDRTLCCNLIWPRTSTPTAENGQNVAMVLSSDKLSATWPSASQIYGTARQGDPPGGDFAPASAGVNYRP